MVHGLRMSDGVQIRAVPGIDTGSEVPWVGPGSGDTFYVNNNPCAIEFLEFSSPLTIDGYSVSLLGTYTALLAQWTVHDTNGLDYRRGAVVDHCGKWLWGLPNQHGTAWGFLLVGFNEELLVRGGVHHDGYIYDIAGRRLLGPKPLQGIPFLLGADNVIYSFDCSSIHPEAGTQTLIAYSWNLQRLWSLDLGKGCSADASGVLDYDGVLYFARQLATGIEVVAVQTQSPGLAETAMPTWLYNNRRSGWLE